MNRTRWRKVWHDLWNSKVRTLLVVASIFIGVLNVGTTISMYYMAQDDMQASYEARTPNHAQVWSAPFDTDVINSVRHVPGVAEAEGRRVISAQLLVDGGRWLPLNITAIRDFEDIRLDKLLYQTGVYPPRDKELLIERSSLPFLQADVGERVTLKLADDTIREMQIVGIVHDNSLGPANELELTSYVTLETLSWLHEPVDMNRLLITVEENVLSKTHVEEIAQRAADQIRKGGRQVYLVFVPDPGKWEGASQILGVAAVIALLGLLSVFLAGFLIFNTLSALLAQHVRYVGIMKSIGARRAQIIGMYAAYVGVLSLLGTGPAIPLAGRMGAAISGYLAQQFNYNSLGYRLVPQAVAIQMAVGLVVPLVAGMIPVLIGSRVVIREALSSYGLDGGGFGGGAVDRLIEQVRFVSRPVMISLRNTFRRKGRLAFTLATLTLGGAIFIGVFSLRSSLLGFMESISQYFMSDVNISFDRLYPIEEVDRIARAVPGVVDVEGWAFAGADLLRDDGTAADVVQVQGVPASSTLIEPVMLEGRWIEPGDMNAMVVNNAFWRVQPDLEVGDTISLGISGTETEWVVVGVFQFVDDIQLMSYADYDYLARELNMPNRSSSYRVTANVHSLCEQEALGRALQARFDGLGMHVSNVTAGASLVEANTAAFDVIVYFMLLMAVLIAVVGAVGLMGTMSMNVLDRTREIGVMRAIGASDGAVLGLVLVEGMVIGLISWVLAAILSVPIGRIMFDTISQAIFHTSAEFIFTAEGLAIWFAIAVVLSAVASILPARSASRLTIREVLAYE